MALLTRKPVQQALPLAIVITIVVLLQDHGHSVEPDFKVKEWQVDWAWPRVVELQRYRSVGEVCYIGGTTCGGGKWTGHILWKMVGLCFSVIPETR
jgi:hypothetical protein